MEAKDVFESLGYKPDQFKTPEEFRNAVTSDFIRRTEAEKDPDIVKSIVGAKLGKIENIAFKKVKELGLDIKDDDFKEAKYTDEKMEIVFNKLKDFHTSETSSLKKLVESKPAEAVKEWQERYGQLEKKFQSTEEMNKTLAQQIVEKENWAKTEVKTFKMNDALYKEKEKVKSVWKESPSEFEIKGFEATMNEKYEVDLDDKEGLIVYEKATKQRIKNPNVVGAWFGYSDVYEMELKKAGLDRKNPHSTEKKVVNPFAVQNQNGVNEGGKKLPINPNFFSKK